MESAPVRPPGKRRRWMIVAVLLVFAPLVAWSYWSRADAKFVGKWEIASSVSTMPGKPFSEFSPRQVVELRSNGLATCQNSTPGTGNGSAA